MVTDRLPWEEDLIYISIREADFYAFGVLNEEFNCVLVRGLTLHFFYVVVLVQFVLNLFVCVTKSFQQNINIKGIVD